MTDKSHIQSPLSQQQLQQEASCEYNDFSVHRVDPKTVVKPRKLFVHQDPMSAEDTFWPGKKKVIPDYSRINELDRFAIQVRKTIFYILFNSEEVPRNKVVKFNMPRKIYFHRHVVRQNFGGRRIPVEYIFEF